MLGEGLRLMMMMVVVELVSATSSHGCNLNSRSNCVDDYQDNWKMVNELKGKETTPILPESHEALQRREFGDSPFGSFGRKFTNNGFSTRNSGGSGVDSSSGSIDPNQGLNTRFGSQFVDQFGSQVGNQFGSSSGLDENRQSGRGSFTRFINEASTQSRSSPSPSNNFNSPHSNSFGRGDINFEGFGSQSGSNKPWNPNSVNSPTPNTRSNYDISIQSPYDYFGTQHHSNQVGGSYDRSLTPDQSNQSLRASTSSQSNYGIKNIKNRQSEPQSQYNTGSSDKHKSMMDRYLSNQESYDSTRNSFSGPLKSRLGGSDSYQSRIGLKRDGDVSRPSFRTTREEGNKKILSNINSSNRQYNEDPHYNTHRLDKYSRYKHNQLDGKSSDKQNYHRVPEIKVKIIKEPQTQTSNGPGISNIQPQGQNNRQSISWYSKPRDTNGNNPDIKPTGIRRTNSNRNTPTDRHRSMIRPDDSYLRFKDMPDDLKRPEERTDARYHHHQEESRRQNLERNHHQTESGDQTQKRKPHQTESRRQTQGRNPHQTVSKDQNQKINPHQTESRDRNQKINPRQTESRRQTQGRNPHQTESRRQTQGWDPHHTESRDRNRIPRQTKSRDRNRERNPHQTVSRRKTQGSNPHQTESRDQNQERKLPTRENSEQRQNKNDIFNETSEQNQVKKYPYRGNKHQNQVNDPHQKGNKNKNDVTKDKLKTPNNQTEREKTPNQKYQTQRSNPNERDQTKRLNPNERDQTKKSNPNGRNQDTRQECLSNKSSPRPVVKNFASPGLSTSTSLQQLYNEVNRIRQENCLPPLSVSSQLQQTAEMKCQDMEKYFINRPVTEIHDWVAPPYTCSFYGDLDCMEEKPRQITGYPHKAHEISAWFSGIMNVEYAINGWIHSSGHFDVLSEQGNYKDIGYLEMGACISAHNSNIWFGKPDQQSFNFSYR